MKHLLIALSLVLGSQFVAAQVDHKETKQVCVDIKDKAGKAVTDPKTGKVKQNCKEVKQHKKLEGTDVPVIAAPVMGGELVNAEIPGIIPLLV
jgi:hypothetical protein